MCKNKICPQKSFHLLKHRESRGQMNTQQHPLVDENVPNST